MPRIELGAIDYAILIVYFAFVLPSSPPTSVPRK
jgi:hypothetical protein